jgi:hypothetical protein
LPVFYEVFDTFIYQKPRAYPENAETISRLGYSMIKEPSRFNGTFFHSESIVHHQDNVNIIRIRFGGHVAPKDNESRQATGVLSQFIHMRKTESAHPSLPTCRTETPYHLIQVERLGVTSLFLTLDKDDKASK